MDYTLANGIFEDSNLTMEQKKETMIELSKNGGWRDMKKNIAQFDGNRTCLALDMDNQRNPLFRRYLRMLKTTMPVPEFIKNRPHIYAYCNERCKQEPIPLEEMAVEVKRYIELHTEGVPIQGAGAQAKAEGAQAQAQAEGAQAQAEDAQAQAEGAQAQAQAEGAQAHAEDAQAADAQAQVEDAQAQAEGAQAQAEDTQAQAEDAQAQAEDAQAQAEDAQAQAEDAQAQAKGGSPNENADRQDTA